MDHPSPAFERLHALVRKGYVADLGNDDAGGAIRLTHLGRTPDLILHADGAIERVVDKVPRHKRALTAPDSIPAGGDSDQVAFLKFVEGVPRATLRDRTRRWRTRYVYTPTFLLVLWGLSLTFTVVLMEGM